MKYAQENCDATLGQFRCNKSKGHDGLHEQRIAWDGGGELWLIAPHNPPDVAPQSEGQDTPR